MSGRQVPILGAATFIAAAFLLNILFSLIVAAEISGHFDSIRTAQQRQGERITARLCQDLGTMAGIPVPNGDSTDHRFNQAVHDAWAGLYRDIGCAGLRP